MDLRASAASVIIKLFIFCTFTAVSGVFTAKAFYCRDPDTGKLYPVNSTWLSTSFCGRYTCKLRKKAPDNQPTRQQLIVETKPKTEKELSKNCSQPIGVIVEDKPKADVNNGTHKDKENTYINLEKFKKVDEAKNIQLAASTSDGDRYLTEEEITALSLLLQTMKKSDLEAILEVYNLAQDIYKELDKLPDEKLTNITQDEKSKEKKLINNEGAGKKSYWYEPLTAANNKLKEAEIVEAQQEQPFIQTNAAPAKPKDTGIPKSFYEGLNMLEDTKNNKKILEIVPKNKMNEKPFFEGPLARNDFRKLPYYHPLTNFQKQASYVRPTGMIAQLETSYAQSPQAGLYPSAYLHQSPPLALYQNQQNEIQQAYVQQQQLENKPPQPYPQNQNAVQSENRRTHGKCSKSEPPFRLIPWSDIVKKPDGKKYDERKMPFNSEKNYEPKSVSSYAESRLTAHNLELPFAYLQNYNLSSLNPYNGDNAWSLLNIDNKPHRHQASYRGAYMVQNPHGDISNAEVKEDDQVQNIKDSKELADWQTAPLTINVINEVKANIAKSKFLPYPFRKKVKLERVGRLIKLEDAGRTKRDIKQNGESEKEASQEEYEVYIEKSTCETDTEPGFFRMGNATQPYPACCPQRIPS